LDGSLAAPGCRPRVGGPLGTVPLRRRVIPVFRLKKK